MGDGEAFTEGGIVIGLSTDAVPYEIYTPGFGSVDGELAAMLEARLPPKLAHLAAEIAASWSDVPGIKEVLSTVPNTTATATLDRPLVEFDRKAAERENQRLANQCDHFGRLDPGTTNTEMVRRFDCPRPLRTESQLVEERELLDARVRNLKLAARRAA
jgi:hypothetical protein